MGFRVCHTVFISRSAQKQYGQFHLQGFKISGLRLTSYHHEYRRKCSSWRGCSHSFCVAVLFLLYFAIFWFVLTAAPAVCKGSSPGFPSICIRAEYLLHAARLSGRGQKESSANATTRSNSNTCNSRLKLAGLQAQMNWDAETNNDAASPISLCTGPRACGATAKAAHQTSESGLQPLRAC